MISDRSTQGLFCSVLEFARTGPDCECDTPHTLVSRCSGARRVTDCKIQFCACEDPITERI